SKLWIWKKSQLFTLLTSPSLAPMDFWKFLVYADDFRLSGAVNRYTSEAQAAFPRVFRAVYLPSGIGSLVRTTGSGHGYIRRAQTGEVVLLVYGPHLPLPPGHYQARFFLRALPTEQREDVALIDVVTKGGTQRLPQATLVSSEFSDDPQFK